MMTKTSKCLNFENAILPTQVNVQTAGPGITFEVSVFMLDGKYGAWVRALASPLHYRYRFLDFCLCCFYSLSLL